MPGATQELDSNKEYIFIDGRYYRKDEISSDLLAKLRQRDAGLIILDDVFLNNLIAHCKKKKVDLSEVPLKVILRFKYGTGNFDPGYFDAETQYDFDVNNGIVYDNALFRADDLYSYTIPSADKWLQKSNKNKPFAKINIKNSIPHPFANQLAAAVRYAKTNNKDSIDLNQVLKSASKNPVGNAYALPKPAKKQTSKLEYLVCGIMIMFAMMILGIALPFHMVWIPIAVVAAVGFTGSIIYNFLKTGKIENYFLYNQQALTKLDVKPTTSNENVMDFWFNVAIYLTLSFVSGLALLIPFIGCLAVSRTRIFAPSPIKSIYNLMRSKENPLEFKDKVKVGLVAATGVGLIGSVIASSYLLPVLGIGLLSAALGPAGVGVIAAVIFLVVARFVLNYYAEKRLNKLHPKVVEIHAEKQAQRTADRLGFREINEIIPDAGLDNSPSNDATNVQNAKRNSKHFDAKTTPSDGQTKTLYGDLILQLRNTSSSTTSSSFTPVQPNDKTNVMNEAAATSGSRKSNNAY